MISCNTEGAASDCNPGAHMMRKNACSERAAPKVIFALACLMPSDLAAQEAKVTQLISKDLTGCPGKII
jgi:hypothetical protein